MVWTRETAHASFVSKGSRGIGFWARRLNGQWVCIVVEGPKPTAATFDAAMHQVFDDHSHHVLTITPRKKGARVTFEDVKRAANKFAREWRPGKASPCDCGPIANGNDE